MQLEFDCNWEEKKCTKIIGKKWIKIPEVWLFCNDRTWASFLLFTYIFPSYLVGGYYFYNEKYLSMEVGIGII